MPSNSKLLPLRTMIACALLAAGASAQAVGDPHFVNGLALAGNALDLSGGTSVNNGRLGYFSDLYYDTNRREWWGLSDRGPGGGLISYDTRVQRFAIDFDATTGAISNFQVKRTVVFRDPNNVLGAGAGTLNGLAPSPVSVLGRSFDPEGFVVNPRNGNFLVSDEYGPSLYEFDRSGVLLRKFNTPARLQPTAADGSFNFAGDGVSGRRGNRGFEGLAVSPDGRHAYAMLQSAMVDEGGGSGTYNRIVKFDTATGEAVAQYLYQMEGSSQGRGISALVAINETEFLVLERNNRGIGVGAEAEPPNKKVYRIDLTGATDVIALTVAGGVLPAGVVAVGKAGTPFLDLGADTLAEVGGRVPEKWEGLAIGPQLANGSFLMLAGTDNDYSVTQSGSGEQFDVYFDFATGATVQCALDVACAPAGYGLLPGVLHSYAVSAGELGDYRAPVPEPAGWALMLAGLGVVAGLRARRREG
jgi:hypothetical protein